MEYFVESKSEAITDLERLTRSVQNRIVKKIHWLAANFDLITPEPLKGDKAGFFKLRVGDYRVIYDFNVELKTIVIHQIGHRSEIYG